MVSITTIALDSHIAKLFSPNKGILFMAEEAMVTLLYQKTCYDTTYRFDDWIQTSKNNTVITMMFSSKKGSHKEN